MVDPRKEISEAFEMISVLKTLSLRIVQDYNEMPGNVRDQITENALSDLITKLKAVQEKARDAMRSIQRLRDNEAE